MIDTRDLPPDIGTFVVAVQRNGSWYVSPAYTALEYVRVVNDLPAAEYGSGRAAAAQLGADTPEAAVQDALTAWSTGDWDRLWMLAPPERGAGCTTTAPRSTRRWPTREARTSRSTASKPRRRSTATRRGSPWWQTVSPRTDRRGRSTTGATRSPTGTNRRRSGPTCGTAGLLGSFTVGVGPFGGGESSDDAPLHVTAVQRDGRWYISPVGTVLDIVDSVVSATTQDQIYALLGLYEDMSVDGAVTLGQPVHVDDTACRSGCRCTRSTRHAEQRIVGELDRDRASDANPLDYVSATVVQPDGSETVRLVQPVRRPGTHPSGRRHVSHRALRGDEQPLVVHRLRRGRRAPELLTRDNSGSRR